MSVSIWNVLWIAVAAFCVGWLVGHYPYRSMEIAQQAYDRFREPKCPQGYVCVPHE